MLFRKPFLEGIAVGRITVAFRRWRRPTVRAGGTLKTPVGVLAIESVSQVAEQDISPRDAKKAGFESAADAIADLVAPAPDASLYRIEFRLAGEDPRIELRNDDELSGAELESVRTKLDRMDRASVTRGGTEWTRATLRLIAKREGVRAGDLAPLVGMETADFKVRVRRLKNLGLTESLGTGYRISPRGKRVLNG